MKMNAFIINDHNNNNEENNEEDIISDNESKSNEQEFKRVNFINENFTSIAIQFAITFKPELTVFLLKPYKEQAIAIQKLAT